MSKVPPLRYRTCSLQELQRLTLELASQIREQPFTNQYELKRSDQEFIEQIVSPLEERIQFDIEILRVTEEEVESIFTPRSHEPAEGGDSDE